MFPNLVKNEQGAVMVEFTLVATLLFVLTFGIVEFGYLFWQWNSAEKATQLGVRRAVVSDPVATGLSTADCGNANVQAGTLCSAARATSFGNITCTWDAGARKGTCTGCAAGVSCTFATAPFNNIVQLMQAVFPLIQPQNVTVQYAFVGLGFAGRPTPVPAVTVGLTGMTFGFVTLQALLGFAPITLPDFRATLTAEDLDSAAPS